MPGQPVDLDLVDVVELILDGVLDGRDVAQGSIHLVEGRVQGGGLPAPVGPLTMNSPYGEAIKRRKTSCVSARHAQVGQGQ